MHCKSAWLSGLTLCLCSFANAQQPDVNQIISNSVLANQRDFKADSAFNYKERDRTPSGSKTYQVTMIYGSPYNRLLAIDGVSLSPQQERQEIQKQQQETDRRKSESPDTRRARIAKYQQGLKRDNNMVDQLTEAFTFKLVGSRTVRGFKVWVLKAMPKPGYQPPNMDSQVLLGMQGEMWIDQKTFQWVHVHATVIHPVSI